jgi:hypothetical protein
MIINISAPQVANPNSSSPKVARPEKLAQGDSDSDHVPINQYLWHPKPPIPKVLVGSRLIIVVASMNHFLLPIKNSSTHRIIQRKRPIIQTTITFVGEHNYE